MMAIRVVLVDDQELARVGLRMLLDSRSEVEVVGEAANGEQALDLLSEVETDVVLMDIRMPVLDGVETTRRLLRSRPGAQATPKVLVLTTFDQDSYVRDALRAGASGFLIKDTALDELVAAIGHVHAGDAVVAPSATRRLLDHFAGEPERAAPADPGERLTTRPGIGRAAGLAELTRREHEVLLLLAQGLSNAEISTEMVVSEGTVKTHVRRILTKLDLRDRVQAVVFAHEQGLIGPR